MSLFLIMNYGPLVENSKLRQNSFCGFIDLLLVSKSKEFANELRFFVNLYTLPTIKWSDAKK